MLVSKKWLDSYFEKAPFSTTDDLVGYLTDHVFEVESVEEKTLASGEKDTVIDVKVLPDRAHYALCHRGVATEIANNLVGGKSIPRKDAMAELAALPKPAAAPVRALSVKIEAPEICRRYIGRVVEGVSASESPQWMKDRLEAIGQRSINSIVDAGNIVMFDCGQPLHAFDADKVKGALRARFAAAGEKMTTLDGKELELKGDMLVIADDEGPLALAGIKGGTRAAIDASTKNIVIEAAQFSGVSVRRTSAAAGIRNDSSKRFENEITPELAARGMDYVSRLIGSLSPDARFGEPVDVYPAPASQTVISYSIEQIRRILGLQPDQLFSDFNYLLETMGLSIRGAGKNEAGESLFEATVPYERLDLAIPEDLAEEAGRLWGYSHIIGRLPKPAAGQTPVNKVFYYSQKARAALAAAGFSEVFTPSLVKKGDLDIANPLASDKRAFRKDLSENLSQALALNLRNAPLLGLDRIRVFEIGTVFAQKRGERLSLALGAAALKSAKGERPAETVQDAEKALMAALGASAAAEAAAAPSFDAARGVLELDFDALIDALPEPLSWDIPASAVDADPSAIPAAYKPFSSYPFVLRDAAVFVPAGVEASEVERLIREKGTGLLVRLSLFDVFSKKLPDGSTKTSYAFSLVFQSFDRTLSDEETNAIMKEVYGAMAARGWEAR